MDTPLSPIPVSDIRFLLVQGEVVDVSVQPDTLVYCFIDDENDFEVAVGCINEFGKPEIVGIVGEVCPMEDCTVWRISSALDGYNRMVGIVGCMADLIRNRLGTMFRQGQFSDLCDLPQPVTIRGEM